MEKIFSLIPKYCFQGHTHVPGVFTEEMTYLAPDEIDYEYPLGEGKLMVNVGSVGQPRDSDNRSCYAIIDENKILFRRVEYDFTVTAQKIYDEPDLDNFLGDRLKEGR
jgi:predicted phosphodiesterase